jgi:hypothetical protein
MSLQRVARLGAAVAVMLAAGVAGAGPKRRATVAELEAQLAEAPKDARLWSDLGQAALQAGDLDKAADASQLAADLAGFAGDANLRAASLYNLGRVCERRHDDDNARAAYAASHELRPNPTVADALVRMHSAVIPPAPKEKGPCDGPMPLAKLRACVARDYGNEEESNVEVMRHARFLDKGQVPGLRLILGVNGQEGDVFVAVEGPKGWTTLAPIDHETHHGHGDTNFLLKRIVEEPHGAVRLVRIEYENSGEWVVGADADIGSADIAQARTRWCVLDGAPGAPRCEVEVVTACRYDGDEEVGERLRKRHYRARASFTIGEDGALWSTVDEQSAARWLCRLTPQHRYLW